MKVAIAGAGNVGTPSRRTCTQAGHDVLLIEKDPELVERLRPTLDVTWVAATPARSRLSMPPASPTADVVVAATGDDEDNLVISLLAKQEFAVPRVVARVNHPKNQWLFNETWGVDVSVSTPHLLTALVEEAVSVGSLVRLLQFQGGARPPGRGHPGRGLAPPTTRRSPTSASPATRPWWPSSGADRLVVPRGDTIAAVGRRGARAGDGGSGGRGPLAVHRRADTLTLAAHAAAPPPPSPRRHRRHGQPDRNRGLCVRYPSSAQRYVRRTVLHSSRLLKFGVESPVPLKIWRRRSSISTRR